MAWVDPRNVKERRDVADAGPLLAGEKLLPPFGPGSVPELERRVVEPPQVVHARVQRVARAGVAWPHRGPVPA